MEASGEGLNLGVYLCALVGAAIGAAITFGIMLAFPHRSSNDSTGDRRFDDDFDRPRRRGNDDDYSHDRPIQSRDPGGSDDPRFRAKPN